MPENIVDLKFMILYDSDDSGKICFQTLVEETNKISAKKLWQIFTIN